MNATMWGVLLGVVVAVWPTAAQDTGRVATPPTPVGLWTTISDDDGRPTAVVEIRQSGDEYSAVVRALLVPADHDDSICGKCTGPLKDQPVVGMEIMRHMRRDGDEWSGGEILDPENGRTYRARMKLVDGGRRLLVRGYIGWSIFGRTQTWLRRAPAG